ncbi:MAG: sulfatase-like hydrolase/transferase, partial [Planctomycetota bacterium]
MARAQKPPIRRLSLLLLAAVTVGACIAPLGEGHGSTAADPPVHLFLLSGQSNMVGLDPAASFTPAVEAAFSADRVLVVKDAEGGQPIRRWVRGWRAPDGTPHEKGADLYDRLLARTREALGGRALATVTLVWMQGERDARTGWGSVYGTSLVALRSQLEEDLGYSGVHCVVGRLSDFEDARYPDWDQVRAAQMEFADSGSRAAWIDTDDLNDGTNAAGAVVTNDLHYSAKGYRILGARFAHAAIALVAPRPRPNVVLVMADDQGWGDVGYNGHPFVRTPHLDAMAAEGFVFDRFYAAAPVCSPTRAAVLTGRTPVRTNASSYGRYIRPHEETLAESLGIAGYETGLFGKFHLGSAQPDSPCNPGAAGFDEWCVGLNFFDADPYLSRNGVVEPRSGMGSRVVVDDALAFIERCARGDDPFLAVVWFPSPHDPHEEAPDGPALYEGEEAAGYYREITLLDEGVGRLRRTLRDLGVADDTLLWFTSDNGGLVEATSGGRARKGSVYEGGLRVPAVLEWPACGVRGRTRTPVSSVDLYPTLLALTGARSSAGHPLDGADVSALFVDPEAPRPAPLGFWHGFAPGDPTWSDRILAELAELQSSGAPLPHLPERMSKDAL